MNPPPLQGRQQLAPAAGQNANSINKGPAWFQGAPATKIVLAFNVLLHIFLNNTGSSNNKEAAALKFDSYAMRNGKDFYRYFTSKLTFGTAGELIVGTSLLVFLMRKYERELSTRKFVALYGITIGLGIAQEVALQQVLDYRNRVLDLANPIRWQYAGPYPIVGALFTLFHMTAPRLHPRFVSILGFQFSEKSFYYLWFLHLICSGGWNTVVPAMTGCATAILYLHSPLKDFQVPDTLVRSVQPILDRLGLSDAPSPVRGVHPAGAAAAAAANAARQPVQRRAAAAPPPQQQEQQIPTPEPDPAAIDQLTGMGFPRQRVMEALRQSHNNVEHAANRLLTDTS